MFRRRGYRSTHYAGLQVVGTSADLQTLITNAGASGTVTIPAGIYTAAYNATDITTLNNQTIHAENVILDGTVTPTWSASGYSNVMQATVAGMASLGGSTSNAWTGRVIDEAAQAGGNWPYISRYHAITDARRDTHWGYVGADWWTSSVSNATAKTITVSSGDRSEFLSAIGNNAANADQYMVQVYYSGSHYQWAIQSYNSGTGVLTVAADAPMDSGNTATYYFDLVNHPSLCTSAGEYAVIGTTVYYYPYTSTTGVKVPVASCQFNVPYPATLTGLTLYGMHANSTDVALGVSNCVSGLISGVSVLYCGRAGFYQCDNLTCNDLRVENSFNRLLMVTDSPGSQFNRPFLRRNWSYSGLAVWDTTNTTITDFTVLRSGGAHSNSVSVYETVDGKNCDGVVLQGGLVMDSIGEIYVTQSRNNLSSKAQVKNCMFYDLRDYSEGTLYEFRTGTYANDLVTEFLSNTVYAAHPRQATIGCNTNRNSTVANSIVGETWIGGTGEKIKQAGNLFYSNPRAGAGLVSGVTYPQGYASTDAAVSGAAAAFQSVTPSTIDLRPLASGGASGGGDRGCRWSVWPNLANGVDGISPGWSIGNSYTCPTPTTTAVAPGDDLR